MKDITLVIPFYNEENALKKVQENIELKFKNSKKIFINDGSLDRSLNQLRIDKNTTVITNSFNQGYGYSLKKGMNIAKTKYVAWFDADNEHKIEDLYKMYQKIKKDDLDAVIAIRKNARPSIINSIGKKFIRTVAYILGFKLPSDFNCGLRIFRRDKIISFSHLLSNRFSASTSSLIFLIFYKMEFDFFSITTSPRIGKTKVKITDGFKTIITIFKLSLLLGIKKYLLLFGIFLLIYGFYYSWTIYLNGKGLSSGSVLILIIGFLTTLVAYILTYQDFIKPK